MNRRKSFLGFACVFLILSLVLIGCQSTADEQTTDFTSTTQTPGSTLPETTSPPSETYPSTQLPSTTPPEESLPMGAKILWSFLGSPRFGPVVDTQGNIYFSTYAYFKYAFFDESIGEYTEGSWYQWIYSLTPSGEIRWKVPVPEDTYRVVTDLVIGDDGLVYYSTLLALYALDSGGNLRWRLEVPKVDSMTAEAHALEMGSDGTIYLASSVYGQEKGGLCAISPGGQVEWQFVGNGDGYYLTIGQDGMLYFAAHYGPLYAVQPNGSLAWGIEPDGYSGMYGTPTVAADGTVYALTGAPSLLLAISPEGVEKWRSNIAPNQPAAFGADGTIYVGGGASGWDYNAGLFALSSSGEIRWQYELPGGSAMWDIVSTRAIVSDDGTVYFGTNDVGTRSTVYALNEDGSMKWYRKVEGEVTGLNISPNGEVLYAASEDGCVYAMSVTEQEALVPTTPWNDPPADAVGVLGWRMTTGAYGVYLEVRPAEPSSNYWDLNGPSDISWTSDSSTGVFSFLMGQAPPPGHYSVIDIDSNEKLGLDFTGAQISVVSVRGVDDYVYLEVKNTGDLPATVQEVHIDIEGRDEYESQLTTPGWSGIIVFPGQTVVVPACGYDPRHDYGPWGEEGTPIGVTLIYDDLDLGEVILAEQQMTLGSPLLLRNN